MVVAAIETPGPGAPGAPPMGLMGQGWGWCWGWKRQQVEWAGRHPGGLPEEVGTAADGPGPGRPLAHMPPPCQAWGRWVWGEQLRGHGHCPVPGAGVQPRPAQPCPSPQPRWSPPVLPGPAFGLLAAGHGSPNLPSALPSEKATQYPGKPCPPWRWACQVGTCIAVLDTCQHLEAAPGCLP